MIFSHIAFSLLIAAGLVVQQTAAAFPNGVVVYWGQNSANGKNTQKPLSDYCNDDHADVLILSFLNEFNVGKLPSLNLANACTGTYFSGTNLLHCKKVGQDIKTCQSKGKKVLLSLGGAAGSYGFKSDSEGVTFANTLWDLFGNGKSKTRPFDDAVVDGFDLDIEGGGPTGYAAMVKQLRKKFNTDTSKEYYITAAPQCPYPDAMLSSVMNAVGMDAINIQFYNNYCSTGSGNFNFATWSKWAKTDSPNKNVKLFIGVPGSPQAAGSGYISFNDLQPILKKTAATYSNFGGVTIWDASQGYGNTQTSPNFVAAVAKHLKSTPSGTKNPTTSQPHTTKTASPALTTKTQSASKKPHTTTTKAHATASRSNAPAIPTSPVLVGKVTNGGSCSTHGKYSCAGSGFGVCNHGKWVVQSCPAGLSCLETSDGGSVYCGHASTKRKRDVFLDARDTLDPFYHQRVTAGLSVTSVVDNTFEAVINARRLDTLPFKRNLFIELVLPPNTIVTEVSKGYFQQTGNLVTLSIKKRDKGMAAVLIIKGTTAPGVLTAPVIRAIQ